MIWEIRRWLNNLSAQYQMLIAIALFNMIDFLTTKVLIERHGRLDVESNPVLYYPMVFFDSVWVIFVAKIMLIASAWLIMVRHYDPSKHRVATLSLWAVLLIGILVSIFNFGLITVWT